MNVENTKELKEWAISKLNALRHNQKIESDLFNRSGKLNTKLFKKYSMKYIKDN